MARMGRRAVVQTFERWSEAVEEIQGRRSRLTRAVTKCQRRLANAAFKTWEEKVTKIKPSFHSKHQPDGRFSSVQYLLFCWW